MCSCQAYGKTGVPNARGFCLVCGEPVSETEHDDDDDRTADDMAPAQVAIDYPDLMRVLDEYDAAIVLLRARWLRDPEALLTERATLFPLAMQAVLAAKIGNVERTLQYLREDLMRQAEPAAAPDDDNEP